MSITKKTINIQVIYLRNKKQVKMLNLLISFLMFHWHKEIT